MATKFSRFKPKLFIWAVMDINVVIPTYSGSLGGNWIKSSYQINDDIKQGTHFLFSKKKKVKKRRKKNKGYQRCVWCRANAPILPLIVCDSMNCVYILINVIYWREKLRYTYSGMYYKQKYVPVRNIITYFSVTMEGALKTPFSRDTILFLTIVLLAYARNGGRYTMFRSDEGPTLETLDFIRLLYHAVILYSPNVKGVGTLYQRFGLALILKRRQRYCWNTWQIQYSKVEI